MRLSGIPWKIIIYRKKIVDLEDRLRRNNFRIDGKSEKENETWSECEQEVQSLIKDKQGIAKNILIERAHQIMEKGNSGNSGKPRTIVCRFLHYKGETKILKNVKRLKGKTIFICEGFSHETMDLHKVLWEKLKKKHREKVKIAYLHYKTGVVKRRNNQGLTRLCLSRKSFS